METRVLEGKELLATFVHPFERLTEVPRDEIEIWPYVDALGDGDPYFVAGNDVEAVYASADGRYHHVLVPSAREREYLVVVVDVARNAVIGHHALTLTDQYGVRPR